MRRAVQQHGIVTADQLHHDGLDRSSINRLLRRDVLVRAQRGVFRIGSIPDSFESRCAAACLADANVVVTGASAARLWGIRHVFRPTTPELMSTHRSSPLARVTLRHTNMMVNEDVIARPDGIRIASPARSWFDCASHLDDQRFELVTEAVLIEHCQVPTLWHTIRRLDARGRLGLARIRRVLSRRAEWQRPHTQIERRLVRSLAAEDVGGLRENFSIRLASKVDRHLAVCDVARRWGVEIDHVSWHGGRMSAGQWQARHKASAAMGWSIDVVTDVAVHEDIERVAQRLATRYRAFAARAA